MVDPTTHLDISRLFRWRYIQIVQLNVAIRKEGRKEGKRGEEGKKGGRRKRGMEERRENEKKIGKLVCRQFCLVSHI